MSAQMSPLSAASAGTPAQATCPSLPLPGDPWHSHQRSLRLCWFGICLPGGGGGQGSCSLLQCCGPSIQHRQVETGREQKWAGWAWTGHQQGRLRGKVQGGQGRSGLSPRLYGDSFSSEHRTLAPLWGLCSPALEGIPWGLGTLPRCLSRQLSLLPRSIQRPGPGGPSSPRGLGQVVPHPLPSSPPQLTPPSPPALSPTCLLGLAGGGRAPRPLPCGIEGCHADHVGGVAGQVLELHTGLSQEKRLHPLGEVLPVGFPEINLQTDGGGGKEMDYRFLLPLPAPGSQTPAFEPSTPLTLGVRDPGTRAKTVLEILPGPSFSRGQGLLCPLAMLAALSPAPACQPSERGSGGISQLCSVGTWTGGKCRGESTPTKSGV